MLDRYHYVSVKDKGYDSVARSLLRRASIVVDTTTHAIFVKNPQSLSPGSQGVTHTFSNLEDLSQIVVKEFKSPPGKSEEEDIFKEIHGFCVFLKSERNVPRLMMKCLTGQPLNKIKVSSLLEALDIGIKIIEALIELHQKNIIHNDLQESNIVVDKKLDQKDDPYANPYVVSLCDFGLSKRIDPFLKGKDQVRAKMTKARLFIHDIQCLGRILYTLIYKFNPSVKLQIMLDQLMQAEKQGEAITLTLQNMLKQCQIARQSALELELQRIESKRIADEHNKRILDENKKQLQVRKEEIQSSLSSGHYHIFKKKSKVKEIQYLDRVIKQYDDVRYFHAAIRPDEYIGKKTELLINQLKSKK